MRKTTVMLATMGALLVLSAGVALAATVTCDGGGCGGTGEADRISGTANRDTINARGGGDTVVARASGDMVRGGYGADDIGGGGGNDTVQGGPGPDEISGGPGRDSINGANGDDTVRAADGSLDSISCGLGTDTAFVDEADLSRQSFQDFVRLSSCENVTTR